MNPQHIANDFLRTQTFRLSPAGLVSAGWTSTPKNSAAVRHFRGPGPSLLRYMEGREGPAAAFTAAHGAGGAIEGDPAGAADWALLAAAFLAAFSAFLAAFLLGPADDVGAASCNRHK